MSLINSKINFIHNYHSQRSVKQMDICSIAFYNTGAKFYASILCMNID